MLEWAGMQKKIIQQIFIENPQYVWHFFVFLNHCGKWNQEHPP